MTRYGLLTWMWALCLVVIPYADAMADSGALPTRRLVSLAPNLTELVYALGLEEHLVGRSSACDYPPESVAVPVVGGFGRPNREALWQTRPDVVIATDLEKPGVIQQLEQRGVQVLILPCESWDELKEAALSIASSLKQRERARGWIEELDERLDALRARVASRWGDEGGPSVYVEVWGRPLTTAGGHSFLHEVITLAGGRNVTGDLRARYQSVSSEWVIRQDPQVILLAYMLADMQVTESIRSRIGWSAIDAIRHDRIIDGISPDLLLRPGPRLIEGAERLAERLAEFTGY